MDSIEKKNKDKNAYFYSTRTSIQSQKISSPFAKYNSIGQLSCIICNQSIKSELFWNKHVISKTHLDNKIKFKKKIEGENNFGKEAIVEARSFKRNISDSLSESQPKSINQYNTENKKQKFENKLDATHDEQDLNSVKDIPGVLPAGFYDDRQTEKMSNGNLRFQDINSQYEEFKRIIQNENTESELTDAKDEKITDVNRELEEVEDLICRWKKIDNFHNKREEILKEKKKRGAIREQEKESDLDDSELDLDDVMNISLQTKKRC